VAVELLSSEGAAGFTTRNLATRAQTSPPAIYELFGDKGGLLRDVFFAGFRLLGDRLRTVQESGDPRADLVALLGVYRSFMRENQVLSEVMFSRPFSDFQPGPEERAASNSVRVLIVKRVRRCIEAGVLTGDATDLAHVLTALLQGLAAAENARRLGRSRGSIDRRWALAVDAVLAGMAPRP
jgi:AcrR family transcriptional regulator